LVRFYLHRVHEDSELAVAAALAHHKRGDCLDFGVPHAALFDRE
jgi:hypothetical protein